MAIDRDSVAARLATKMDAVVEARRAARIADAEREMALRNPFADFWETVELLNQHGLDHQLGHLQFRGEAWDAKEGVISGTLDLRGASGDREFAYRVRGGTLEIEWPGDAAGRYTAAAVQEAVDRLTDLAAETFAKPD